MGAIGTFGRRAASWTKRFATARNGGVALMFALAMPPMTLMAVCGLDLYRVSSIRRSLQDALDAATLAAARSDQTTDAGIRQVGLTALRANLAQFPYVTLNEDAGSTNFDLNSDGSVSAVARVAVDTLVAGSILGDALDVNVEADVVRAMRRMEVALVIDTTGSMAQSGRMSAARDAAESLVRQLEQVSASQPGADAVRISLVPFSDSVRVLSGFGSTTNQSQAASQSWLSSAANHTGATGAYGLFSAGVNRFKLYDDMRIGWSGCVESRPYPYDVRDTAPSSSNQASMFVPYFSPDWPDQGVFSDSNWSYWTSPTYSYYVNDYVDEDSTGVSGLLSGVWNTATRLLRMQDAYSTLSRDVTKYTPARLRSNRGEHGPNYLCNQAQVVRLTDNFDGVVNGIRAMTPAGDTNIPLGLMWGWHTLSPRQPFGDGAPYDDGETQKVIVLLTDGDNNSIQQPNPDRSLYSSIGLMRQERIGVGASSSSDQRRTALNGRLTELCGNLRDQGVSLFTIGVQVSSGTQSLLDSCATSPDMSFAVSNTAGIQDAFDQITGRIQNLRIAH